MFDAVTRTGFARLAPSPTGAQHLGNARTYLCAWLAARAARMSVILRIEDIDSPRVKPWAIEQIYHDLSWLGLDWDEGPDRGGDAGPYIQSQRLDLYDAAWRDLVQAERVYPCTCSRTDVAQAASAPHREHEGPRYPGTCVGRFAADAASLDGEAYCWRFRTSHDPVEFRDRVHGPRRCDVAGELGDFVVHKKDGTPAYQLAVVVDDHLMGVSEVVGGDDLTASTFRQLELYRQWRWQPPRFVHVPLVVGPDGRRLAKRHGDTRLEEFRRLGVSPWRITGLLAWSLGLTDRREAIHPADLVSSFAWDRLSGTDRPWTFDDEAHAWLLAGSGS